MVSYHVYVDEKGEVAAEFTGRKIRTIPAEYGHTSSLTITDDPEVARLGREVCRRPRPARRRQARLQVRTGRAPPPVRDQRAAHPLGTPGRAGRGQPAGDHVRRPHRHAPAGARRIRTCLDWVHPKDVLAARAHGISMRRVADVAVAHAARSRACGGGTTRCRCSACSRSGSRAPPSARRPRCRTDRAPRPAERRPCEPARAAGRRSPGCARRGSTPGCVRATWSATARTPTSASRRSPGSSRPAWPATTS